jgi:hypothetical protein
MVCKPSQKYKLFSFFFSTQISHPFSSLIILQILSSVKLHLKVSAAVLNPFSNFFPMTHGPCNVVQHYGRPMTHGLYNNELPIGKKRKLQKKAIPYIIMVFQKYHN